MYDILNINEVNKQRNKPGTNSCHSDCFCVESVELLHVHRYIVDIFSYSAHSGILGSDRKQNGD